MSKAYKIDIYYITSLKMAGGNEATLVVRGRSKKMVALKYTKEQLKLRASFVGRGRVESVGDAYHIYDDNGQQALVYVEEISVEEYHEHRQAMNAISDEFAGDIIGEVADDDWKDDFNYVGSRWHY